MKSRILLVILSLLLSGSFVPSLGQSDSSKISEVDIKALLDQQIQEIREKEKAGATVVKPDPAPVQPQKITNRNTTAQAGMNNPLLEKSDIMKIFILIEAAFLVALFILWRRKNYSTDNQLNLKLKKNIRLLREEKLATLDDARLSKIRSRLNMQPIKVNDMGRDIVTRARKYSISKGEVHLAAKLKMLADSNR